MIDPAIEGEILARLRDADRRVREHALAELFERTRRPLFALALRMTGRPDAADDAVQEAFVDVLRGIDGFRGDARLTTWLFRIAIRAALRARARRARGPTALPGELAARGAEPSESAAQREGAARILAALAALPAAQRAVLSLAALDELPQTEIAEILGVPVGTVYSRLHQARERLRERLAATRAEPAPG